MTLNDNRPNKPKISVSAVPYFWSKEAYFDFYNKLAKTSVDIVYIGETVCSKRRSMKNNDWLEVASLLKEAGKEVVLSTLTLLEAESELKSLTKTCQQSNYLAEANDMSAVQVAHTSANPFVAGTAINLYNTTSLTKLHQLGMKRWCMPVELGKQDLSPMMETVKSLGIETEYQVFGRMPLAYSARCFTARHYDLPKDNCQFKCLDDEQGLLVKTQEGDSFAQINGIQTQSAKVNNLIPYWKDLFDFGIDILRVVPVGEEDTISLVEYLSDIINQQTKTEFSSIPFQNIYEYCNGYWFQIEGMKLVS